jgi:hypothetical protein
MCGIVGAFPLNKVDLEIDDKLRRQLILYLHNEVLFETIARGKDSTGMAISYGLPEEPETSVENFWMVLKQPVDTVEFFLNDGESSKYHGQTEEANTERLMDVASLIQRPLNHIIGHTRAKTVGSEFNPLNNHPIIVNDIIGIHNGGCKNYKKIYEKHNKMTPMGEVDSEAIIQLIAEHAEGRALDESDIKYVTERIVGPRAVIAYNRDHPEKIIYFHDKDRPLELAYIEELGLAIICSDRKFFNTAMHVYARARLTVKRDLPALSVQWRHVPTDKGGVIDVTDAYEGDWEADDLFPLVECADVLDEYDTDVHVSQFKKRGSHNSNVAGNKQVSTPNKKKDVPRAEVTDVTKYGYAKDTVQSQQGAAEIQSVTASVVMDDEGEDEDDGLNVQDMYEDDDLLKKGIEYVMSVEGREDESLLLNRHEKDYKSLLAKPLKEEDAAEIVQQLYPDIFGEGFVRGFKVGAEEQAGLQEEDALTALSDKLVEVENDNSYLTKKLEDERDKQRKAAAFIANMKAFIMGAIITNGIARVEGEGSDLSLVFDDDLEQFLGTAKGFHKANPEMVMDLFGPRDLHTLANGMTGIAKEVRARAEIGSSDNSFKEALAKSLKS